MRITLQDIANELGVSKASVSLALRDHPRISAKLRETVRQTADRLGYLPDRALSQIAAHRWRQSKVSGGTPVAILDSVHPGVIPPNSSGKSENSWVELAREEARKRGYQAEIVTISEDTLLPPLFRNLYYRGIVGVVMNQIYREELYRTFPWPKFTCIAVSVGFHCPPVDIVDSDHLGSLQFVWNQFVSRGYRRIALVLFDEGRVHPMWLPVRALYKELARLKRLPPLLHDMRPNQSHELVDWLRDHRADAVIGFTDSVYWNLLEGGYLIPNEVAFASLWSVETSPQQTAGMISMDGENIARAFDLLQTRMHAGMRGSPSTVIFESLRQSWREGLSFPEDKSKKSRASC